MVLAKPKRSDGPGRVRILSLLAIDMIGFLLAIAAAGMLFSVPMGARARTLWLAGVLASAAAALWASVVVLTMNLVWDWESSFRLGGEVVRLRLDAVSALFLALLSLIGGVGAVYGREYWSDNAHPHSVRSGRVWWSVLVLCIGLVLVTTNGLHFLIAWELFTVAAYFLVTSDQQRREVRTAGWLYLGASHFAALFLFAFFASLAARTGSWALGPMRDRPELAPLFWLALVAFGLKAGVFPLHVWLPSAHANAPSHVSAMLSGMTLKVGIYGLVRFSGWLPMPPEAGWVVAFLGVTSAVLGVAFALGQHDLKRLLAYHSVENIGIILVGLGFALVALGQNNAPWGRVALAGGLLHVWNHGLFKSLLFLAAGSVWHATGTREMSQLGGLWRLMPWTASLFALGAVAISGLPPLNGFVSEWLVYLGLFDATLAHGPSAWAAIPAASIPNRRSTHCEHTPQCCFRFVASLTRVQLTVFVIKSAHCLSARTRTTSLLVFHKYGLCTVNLSDSRRENNWLQSVKTRGCVVRLARAPSTCSAIGKFMLTTPFS